MSTDLPNPDLVVFNIVLRKNKIESDIGDIIVKKNLPPW